MKNYAFQRRIHVGLNGGEHLFIRDIDGDGQKELFFRQSPGMLDSSFYPNHCGWLVSQEEKNLFQMTCLRQDGTLMWRYGEPWKKSIPYDSHGGGAMSALLDIDGDGRTEWALLRKNRIEIIDALTGDFKMQRELPSDIFNIMAVQKLNGGKFNLLLKCDGSSPFGYGKPLMCLDSSLNMIWEHTDLNGGGHNIVIRDIDGDGSDEIFEGYNLLDHDGKIIWSHDFLSHSDQTTVCDINDDGTDEVIYCTDNEDFIICDINGRHILTRSDFEHPQRISAGRFIPGMKGMQMFLNNRATHGGSVMLDCEANLLWEFPCNGYTVTLPGTNEPDLLMFSPGPGRTKGKVREKLLARAEQLGYTDLPINEDGAFEPFIVDGEGKIIYRFPFICESLDVTKWGLPHNQKNDFGAGFAFYMEDIDNDGHIEFLFCTRTDVFIYHEI